MEQNNNIKKIGLAVIILLLIISIFTYYKIKNQSNATFTPNESMFTLSDGVYKNDTGKMVNLIKTSNNDGVLVYLISSPDFNIIETELSPNTSGGFTNNDNTLTISSTEKDSLTLMQNNIEIFKGGLAISPHEESFASTGDSDFTWIVRENAENTFNLILKKGDTETEITKNANDCVAVNMFDAPKKLVKNLQYPTMKCAMENTAEFFGVYSKDSVLTVKRVTALDCDEYGDCDLKKESKGIVIK